MVTADRARRPPRFGPEPWNEIAGETWSLWDLWFCAIAVLDQEGDIDALAGRFVDDLRSVGGLHRRDANEAKLSHVRDLRARLAAAGLAPSDLASADVLDDTKMARRARDKVLHQSGIDGRAATLAMNDTPRRLLAGRARFGHWAQFPSDPARFYARFRPIVELKDFVPKGKTGAVADRLRRRLDELDGPRRTLVDRLALYRAFHTAGLVLADAADDSYGTIGDTIEEILLDLEREHRAAVLDYEADTALERLADLYLATRSRDRYLRAAALLGSRAWRPIEQMARSHLDAGDRDAALAVFCAADQPGIHQAHLRRRCHELTGVDLARPVEGRT